VGTDPVGSTRTAKVLRSWSPPRAAGNRAFRRTLESGASPPLRQARPDRRAQDADPLQPSPTAQGEMAWAETASSEAQNNRVKPRMIFSNRGRQTSVFFPYAAAY